MTNIDDVIKSNKKSVSARSAPHTSRPRPTCVLRASWHLRANAVLVVCCVQVGDGWFCGSLDGKVGIFPSSFVRDLVTDETDLDTSGDETGKSNSLEITVPCLKLSGLGASMA